MTGITFASRSGTPSDAAALGFLLDAAGIAGRPAEPGERAHIIHGEGDAADMALRIPLDVREPDWATLAGPDPRRRVGADLEVDVVTAARLLLDDVWPRAIGPEALDRHGRLSAASDAARSRLADRVPIVNRLAGLLAEAASSRFGLTLVPAWPDGRRAAVALSHDVDRPERYALLGDMWRPWRLRRAPRTLIEAAFHLARERGSDRMSNDHWAFDELIALEDRYGLRSTFLFSVTPHHARFGSTLDPGYDASTARYRNLFAQLSEGAWEIGLHASYRSFEAPERLAVERQRLSDLARTDVRGLRHHYWQLGPDQARTLRGHEAAGFTFDASVGFNDAPGFRRGVALPFHVFDEELGRPLRVLELPTTLMDGNLFNGKADQDTAFAAAVAHVDAVRQIGGLAVVDWHSHTSVSSNRRFATWGHTYERLLAWIAAQPDLWATTLGGVADWRAQRTARLRSLAHDRPS